MLRDTVVCILASGFIQVVLGQVVEPIRELLPPAYIKIRAVDPFGVPLIPFDIKLDGISLLNTASSRYFKVPQGRHTVEITARGFAKVSETVEVSDATHQIVLCLAVGALVEMVTNPVSIVVDGSSRAVASCNELMVLPLHCALSRRPTTQSLVSGRFAFSDLKPGSYVIAALAGARICGLTTVNVLNLPTEPIVLKLLE